MTLYVKPKTEYEVLKDTLTMYLNRDVTDIDWMQLTKHPDEGYPYTISYKLLILGQIAQAEEGFQFIPHELLKKRFNS